MRCVAGVSFAPWATSRHTLNQRLKAQMDAALQDSLSLFLLVLSAFFLEGNCFINYYVYSSCFPNVTDYWASFYSIEENVSVLKIDRVTDLKVFSFVPKPF